MIPMRTLDVQLWPEFVRNVMQMRPGLLLLHWIRGELKLTIDWPTELKNDCACH